MVGGWGWREVDREMGKGRWLRVGMERGGWRDGEGKMVVGGDGERWMERWGRVDG